MFTAKVLDQFEAHLTEAVLQAALDKHMILLIIPGGLTGDIQPCDTDLNRPLKVKYREMEQAWLLMQLSQKTLVQSEEPDNDAVDHSLTPTRELVTLWARESYKAASKNPSLPMAFKRNGINLALDGSEGAPTVPALRAVWEKHKLPAFRANLLLEKRRGEGPKTVQDLLATLEPARGQAEIDDTWDHE